VFATDAVAGPGSGAVSQVGFRNPDGSFVMVLANKGPERRVQLLMGGQTLDVTLPADSVQTLEWV
jgi:O-glycosyl hydrolase